MPGHEDTDTNEPGAPGSSPGGHPLQEPNCQEWMDKVVGLANTVDRIQQQQMHKHKVSIEMKN